FTSKGAFKTVAESPGISRETRAELEARARHYPGSTAEEDPPLIFRAFPVSSTDTFAVSLLIDTGSEFNKAAGNYMAHSYVIPRLLLEQVDYNLAWIAAHLPIWEDWEDR